MVRADVAAHSLRPTFLATQLRPLFVITTGLVAVAVVTSWHAVHASDVMGIVGVGALAGGVALGLDDEANSLLRSSPTCALTRLGHRLAILLPAALVAVTTLVVADHLLFSQGPANVSASALAALIATGVAVDVWWGRRRPETAAEAAAVVVMAWALAGSFVPDVWPVQRFAEAWRFDAPLVLVLSVVLVIAGTAGRSA